MPVPDRQGAKVLVVSDLSHLPRHHGGIEMTYCPECGGKVEVSGGEHRGAFSSFSWAYDFTCPHCYATVYVERFGFDYPEDKL